MISGVVITTELIQETLRLSPAVPVADRIVLEGTVIPLGESIVSSKGEHINQIGVRKGEVLTMGIALYQRFGHHASMTLRSSYILEFRDPLAEFQ
jgi:hypothetical protein